MRSTSHLSDNELLMLFVRRNNQAAFTEIVQRYTKLLMATCQNLTYHVEDAEDAFQAVVMTLARKAPQLLDSDSLGGWLYTVAYRQSIRVAKHKPKYRGHVDTELIDDVRDPLHEILVKELQAMVHSELQRLPARYRDAVILCDLQEKTRAEAATELGRTEASVKAAVARGRKQLRMRLLRRGVAFSVATSLVREAIAATSVDRSFVDDACGKIQRPDGGAAFNIVKNSPSVSMSASFVSIIVVAGLLVVAMSAIPFAILNPLSANEPPGLTEVVVPTSETPQSPRQVNVVGEGGQASAAVEKSEEVKLKEDRVALLRELVALRTNQIELGAVTLERLTEPRQLLLEAELELESSPDARFRLIERAIADHKKICRRVEAIYEQGAPTASKATVLVAQNRLMELQLLLLNAQKQLAWQSPE